MPMTTDTELLKVSEAALLLRCSAPTVRRKIASGELPAVKLGDHSAGVRIPRLSVENFLVEHAVIPRKASA